MFLSESMDYKGDPERNTQGDQFPTPRCLINQNKQANEQDKPTKENEPTGDT